MRKGSIFVSLIFVIAWMLVLTTVNEGTALGQTLVSFKIPIRIEVSGVARIDTLWLGVHGDGINPPGTVTDNNYGVDVDSLVYGPTGRWKELQCPPDPLAFTYLSKFVQIPFRTVLPPDGIASTGIAPYDFRGFTSLSQVDTFCINVYGDANDSYVAAGTVTLSWPNNIATYASTLKLKRRVSGTNYVLVVENMATGDTLTYTDVTTASNSVRYLIIVSDIVPPTGVEETESMKPTQFELKQNYPNPFNPTTVLNFSVAKKELTTLKLYNTLGQEVMKLYDGVASPGTIYKATVDGHQLASGIYFYRLISGTQSEIKKMVLLK
jgi:hypothetical protein